MEIHRCRICSRNFANGRALGGHMRSHIMNLCKFEKKFQVQESDQLHHHQSIHSCSSSDQFLDGPEFSVVLQDGESEAEAESSRNNVRRRSKRARSRTRAFSLSSEVSDTTAEADVAHCLMMLSRDKWERKSGQDEDEEEEDSSRHVVVEMKNNNVKKIRGRYRCETCNKVFKSYQALGGHRASYKKIKSDGAARSRGGGPVAETAPAEEKVHECPFCHRVFASGQALGGHKRSHFMGSSNVSSFERVLKSVENLDIDLNLPAPIDDGESMI